MGGQDDRLGQLDAAVGAVNPEGIEERRTVRADLEAEIIVAKEADQRAGREAGLEGEGRVVPGGGLVDRRLDPGPGVVQQHCRGVDRHPVVAVRRRPAEAQELRGQICLGHANLRDRIREGDGRRVDDGCPARASGGRADVHDRRGSGRAASPEVHGLGDAGGRRTSAHPISGGGRCGADGGTGRRDRHGPRGGQRPREGLVAGKGLRPGEDRQFGRSVRQRVTARGARADACQREGGFLCGIGIVQQAEDGVRDVARLAHYLPGCAGPDEEQALGRDPDQPTGARDEPNPRAVDPEGDVQVPPRPEASCAGGHEMAVAVCRARWRRGACPVENRELHHGIEQAQRLVVGDMLLRLGRQKVG